MADEETKPTVVDLITLFEWARRQYEGSAPERREHLRNEVTQELLAVAEPIFRKHHIRRSEAILLTSMLTTALSIRTYEKIENDVGFDAIRVQFTDDEMAQIRKAIATTHLSHESMSRAREVQTAQSIIDSGNAGEA